MIRRTLADTFRLYRGQWWRLVGLVLLVGTAVTLLLFGVARLASVVAHSMRSTLVVDGHVRTSGLIAFIVGMAIALVIGGLPIVIAAIAATARITDDALAGRQARVLRSLGRGFLRFPKVLAAEFVALVVLVALTILSPVISAAGIVGLVLTPIARLLARRWSPARRWPQPRQLLWAAVPFALAIRWAATTAFVIPTSALDVRKVFPALRHAAAVARVRGLRVVLALLASLVAVLALTAGLAGIGYLIGSTKGGLLTQAVAQSLLIPLPIVVITILYRLSQSTPPGGLIPASATAPYAPGAGPEEPPFLAESDPALAVPWRWRHRRVRLFLPPVLVASTIGFIAATGGTAPSLATTVSTSVTMTVTSSADTDDSTTEANCLNASGTCTLRAAIAEAASLADAASATAITINFSTDLTIDVPTSDPIIFSTSGEGDGPPVGTLTIDGTGHSIVIDGQNASQVLGLGSPTWTFAINNLEIRNGAATASGNLNGAGLVIGGAGGGTSTISNDTFDNNVADNAGGAIFATGPVMVVNSTFFDNTAAAAPTMPPGSDYPAGGADLYSVSGGMTVDSDTFVGSTGGPIVDLASAGSTISLNNSLIGVVNSGGSGAFDCTSSGGSGGITGSDNVVVSDTTCPGVISAGSGPTVSTFGSAAPHTPPVLPLAPASAGNPANAAIGAAGNDGVDCPATDERGFARPTTGCDAGAYQYDPATATSVLSSQNPSVFGTPVTFTAHVSMPQESQVPTGAVQFSVDGTASGSPVTVDQYGNASMTTSSLSTGSHDITAAFQSNVTASYSDSDNSTSPLVQQVDQTAGTVAIQASANPALAGTAVTFTITVTASSGPTPTGTVSLSDVTGTPVVLASGLTLDSSGAATFETSALPDGQRSLVASYSGDTNTGPASSSTFDEDIQTPSTLTLTPSPTSAAYGVPITFQASVAADNNSIIPTGNVEFTIGVSPSQTVTEVALDSTGKASLVVPSTGLTALPVGTDQVDALYLGDTTYAQSSTQSASVVIDAASTSTQLGASPTGTVAYGVPVTLTATVTNTATSSTADPDGSVTFANGTTTIGSGNLTGNGDGTSTATYITTAGQLPVGTNSLTATYVPSTNFLAGTAGATSVTVGQVDTGVALVSDANPSAFGQMVHLTATVTAAGASTAVPTGSVTFTDGTTTLGTVTLSSGAATLGTTALAVGTHSITATYATSGPFNGSVSSALSQEVDKVATTTTIALTPLNSAPFGTSVQLSVTVTPAQAGAPAPGGSVTVTEGTNTLATITLSGGQGSTDLTGLSTTSHTFAATYGETTSYLGSTGSAGYTIGAASTSTGLGFSPSAGSVFGNQVTITATVTDTSSGSTANPTGSVTFSEDGTTLGTVSLTASGSTQATAVLNTTALPESHFDPGGVLQITASYNGDTDFNSSSITQNYAVAQGTTSVGLQVGSTTFGTPTTLTATVTVTGGTGTPTGSVLFTDDANGTLYNFGTVTLSGGQAVVTGVNLPNGAQTLTATYTSGDANFVAGSPATLPVTVSQGTPTVTDSANASGPTYGQSDSTSATVAVNDGGAAPTGTVTFTATGPGIDVVLGTASVTGTGPYTATLNPTTAPIPVGATTIVATYNGDTHYTSATGSTTAPSITAAATSTAVGVSPSPSLVGQSVTLTATVTSSDTSSVPTGTVTFSFGGVTVGSAPVNVSGQASLSITPSTPGTPSAAAQFVPTANFVGSTGSTSQTVNALPVIVTIGSNTQDVAAGQQATFTVTVSPTNIAAAFATAAPTGTVTVAGGGSQCTVTLAPSAPGSLTSTGSCQASWATSGQRTVVASYPGAGDYAAGASGGFVMIVAANNPVITFTTTPATWVTGDPFTLNWTIAGPTQTDGTTTITLNGVPVCTSTALIGSCSHTFAANYRGSASFILAYSGDSAWAAGFASLLQTVVACVPLGTISMSPAGAGTVTVLTPANCDGGTGYLEGTVISLSETPGADYSFQEWADTGSTSNIENFTIAYPGPFSDEAIFTPICVTLTLLTYDASSSTGARIDSSASPNCGPAPQNWQYLPGEVQGSFDKGTALSLTAVAPYPLASGATQVFYQWSGDVGSSGLYNPVLPLTLNGDANVVAVFGVTCYHGITFTSPAEGTAVISAPNCQDPNGPGYAQYSTIDVSTQAYGSQYFVRWSSNVTPTAVHPGSSTGTVGAIQNNMTITATYGTCVYVPVTANGYGPAGEALGVVTVDPTGNCPTLGAGWYTPGTTLLINATTAPGTAGVFKGWEGQPTESPADLPYNLAVVNQSGALTATFFYGPGCQPFATQVIPAGKATIGTAFTFGNSCPAGQYDDTVTSTGSPATLTATPTSGNPIVGWTGQTTLETAGGAYQTQNFNGVPGKTISSTFLGPTDMTAWICESINPQITLISPNGTSHTGPAPANADFIDAAPVPDCPIGQLDYTVGTLLQPEANAPSAGYTFQGWSGAASGSAQDPAPILLDGSVPSVTLTATYQVICHTLTSNFSEGVAMSPAPNCPDTPASANEYIGGTLVALQETGHSGDNFNGWTGTPDGTSGSYAWTTMTADESIYADYEAKSVGQQIADAFTTAGDEIAITAKKVVGVVAGVAGAIMLGVNPVTMVAGLVVLGGTAVSDLLTALGVSGGTLDSLNASLSDISQTLGMLDGALTCATVWSANANTSPTSTSALSQTGAVIANTYFADDATTANAEALAQQEAAQQTAFETPYSLTGTPTAAVANIDTLDQISLAKSYVSKYGSRLGVVGAVASGVYSEVTSGPNVGWDSSATAAWTNGDAYNACVNATEPSYMQ